MKFYKIHNGNILYKVLLFATVVYVFFMYPKLTANYAYIGLKVWFENMIISLFPMMVIVNLLLMTKLYVPFIQPFAKLLYPVFRLPVEAFFVIFFGFLGGFPIGAKLTCQLYEDHLISEDMANYLLAFVNQIGPAYFSGFVLIHILSSKAAVPIYLPYFLMYGVPLLYGILLRYTVYYNGLSADSLNCPKEQKKNALSLADSKNNACKRNLSILSNIPYAIQNSCEQITILGGYMIICNALRALIAVFLKKHKYISLFGHCILEISGGLKALHVNIAASLYYPVWVFSLLSFGGICCFLQTASLLTCSKLSIKKYMLHKIILCSITTFFSYLIYILLC